MNILHDLWNGNLAPCEKIYHQNSEYHQIRNEHAQQFEELRQTLSKEQQELLEKNYSQYDKLIWLELEDAFVKGFRLGGQIVLAVLEK